MSQVGVTESGEIERPSLLSVLYVGEDDGAMAELEALLADLGPRPVRFGAVASLTEAITHEGLVDVALLDVAGEPERVARLRAASRAPIIALISDDPGEGAAAVRAGADDHLPARGLDAATLERALRYANERGQLQREARVGQRLEAVGRLAGAVSHDFNNLLMVIRSCVSFVASDLPHGDPRREELEVALDAVDRAAGLTHHLVAFGGRQPRQVAQHDVGRVAQELADSLRHALGECHTLRVSACAEATPAQIDRDQLEQVLVGLVENAREAMPGGGTIDVDVRAVTLADPLRRGGQTVGPGDYVRVSVQDHGHGMAPENLERAFEPFFTTRVEHGGRGLGLSSASGIVRQSGGAMTLESQMRRGSCVKIYLPRAIAEREDVAPEAEPLFGARVLVVDDDRHTQRLVTDALRKRGASVICERDGTAALRRLAAGEPVDLLLADLVMPGLSGREVVARARALRPDVASVVMSDYASFVDHLGGEILHKPFSRRALFDVAARALEQRGWARAS